MQDILGPSSTPPRKSSASVKHDQLDRKTDAASSNSTFMDPSPFTPDAPAAALSYPRYSESDVSLRSHSLHSLSEGRIARATGLSHMSQLSSSPILAHMSASFASSAAFQEAEEVRKLISRLSVASGSAP